MSLKLNCCYFGPMAVFMLETLKPPETFRLSRDDFNAYYENDFIVSSIKRPKTSIYTCLSYAAKYAEPRKKVVTWEEIVRIIEDIESSWLELGTALELGKEKLRKIDNRNKSNREKAMAVLEMWMNEGGSDATVGRLEDTLRKIGKGSIADKLLGM